MWRGGEIIYDFEQFEIFEIEDRGGDDVICRYFAINSEGCVRRNNSMYISTFAG